MSERADIAREHAAAPSTLTGLQRALKSRVESIVAAFPLFETKSGSARVPSVHDFTLPPKDSASAEDFPFVAVRPRTGTDTEEGAEQNARATFDIEIGTYSDTNDGIQDVLAIVDAIRSSLGTQPHLDGTAFEHVGPLVWDTPFPQPRPQWLALVTTIWQLPRPQRAEARNPTEG